MKKMRLVEVLTRGVEHVYPNKSKLERLMRKRKIRLYQGFDPSMPSLHLGNFVGLMKLRQFQKLGHEVIFLIGDFTGMIGDPTDKPAARKKLTRAEVIKNYKSWKTQARSVIDFYGKNPAKIMFNSSWNDDITFKGLIDITSNFTVQQMLERDMFQERLRKNQPIYLHEFLYPVAQAIDSVKMEVDLEIGGSDQIFNMLAGRTLMKAVSGKDKYVLATKLLVDAKGDKVGKTTGNALFLTSTPNDFYSGIMSFPDEVINLGFELLTEVELNGIENLIKANPLEQKKRLAYEVVKIIWGDIKAQNAQLYFEKTFQKKELPESIKTKRITSGNIALLDLVWETGLVDSRSQIKRLIEMGAIEVDGVVKNNPQEDVNIGKNAIIKVGKSRFIKVIV